MKRMNDLQEFASADEQAADAAIADILREIADSLADQSLEGSAPDAAENLSVTVDTGDETPPTIE